MADDRLNCSPDACGGEKSYYPQASYDSIGGPLELATRGNYKCFENAMLTLAATVSNPATISLKDYIKTLDDCYPTINGKLPSEFIMSSPQAYFNGRDGSFFFTEIGFNQYWVIGKLIFNDPLPLVDYKSFVTHAAVRERIGGVGTLRLNPVVEHYIYQKGALVWPLAGADPTITPDTHAWTEGGYMDIACARPVGASACDPKAPDLWETKFFGVARSIPDIWKDRIVVFPNGPRYNEFGTVKLSLKSADPQVTVRDFDGTMLVVELNGSTGPIVVTDGTRDQTYNPVYSTQFIRWTQRPQMSAAVRAASYDMPTLAPGEIGAVFGSGLSLASGPVEMAQGRMADSAENGKVAVNIVASNGTEYRSMLFYASPGQINFLVPREIPLGPALVYVRHSGVATQSYPVTIVQTSPTVFIIDWVKSGTVADPPKPVSAAISATGENTGQIVSASTPAKAGTWISLYATGIGAVDPPVQTGVPVQGLHLATNQTTVKLGNIVVPVSFAGSAPGFAGLDQVNFQIPTTVSGGLLPVTVTVGEMESPATYLFVGP